MKLKWTDMDSKSTQSRGVREKSEICMLRKGFRMDKNIQKNGKIDSQAK